MLLKSPVRAVAIQGLACLIAAAPLACVGELATTDAPVGNGEAPADSPPPPAPSDLKKNGGGALPEKPNTQVASCSGPPRVGQAPLRRLSREEFSNSVQDLLGVKPPSALPLSPDGEVGTFHSNVHVGVTDAVISQYVDIAEAATTTATTNVVAFSGCATPDLNCMGLFVRNLAQRAFRRPLTNDESLGLTDLLVGGTPNVGLARALQAVLLSPYFLYLFEKGEPAPDAPGLSRPTAHELAGRLSFFLWQSVPDADLLLRANDGSLNKPSTLEEQARRMLTDPRAKRALHDFHDEWLALEDMDDVEKDPKIYPAFTPTIRTAMAAEKTRFIDHLFANGARFETLLTGQIPVGDPILAKYYATEFPQTADISTVSGKRSGLLTMGAVMAIHGKTNQTAPVQRGLMVQNNVACVRISLPPADVAIVDPVRTSGVSRRKQIDMHAQGGCAGCHSLIDPAGFAFENFDGAGRYQTTDAGGPIDASGELRGTDVDGVFNGALQITQRLAQSDQVKQCLTRQWFRFALGREEAADDHCTIQKSQARFAAAKGDIRELIVSTVLGDAFRYRLP